MGAHDSVLTTGGLQPGGLQPGGLPRPYIPQFSKSPDLHPPPLLFLSATLIQVLGWVPTPLDLAPSPWWSPHFSNYSGATGWPPKLHTAHLKDYDDIDSNQDTSCVDDPAVDPRG